MAVSDIRGNVDTIILKVLFEGDRYGYDMIKAINARGEGQWEIKQPTLYARLKVLEKQGFISSYRDSSETGGGARKYYTLTDRGREVFLTYRSEFERTRDLFTNLITGEAPPMQFDDDFSDVQDESYDIPKKRRTRPAKKQDKPAIAEQTAETENTEEPVASDEAVETEQPAPTSDVEQTEEIVDNTVQSEYGEIVSTEPDYVQQSFLSFADEHEQTDDEQTVQPDSAQATENIARTQETVVTDTVDPRELISRIYESSATDKRSYFESTNKSSYENDFTNTVPAVKQSDAVRTVPPTAPAEVKAPPPPAPIGSTAVVPTMPINEESLARREYRDILGDLIERSEARSDDDKAEISDDDEVASSSDRIEIRQFSDALASVKELGDNVEIRDHNDSAQQYNRQYYYYSHKLMFTHYCIMCAAMLALGIVMFFSFRFGLGLKQRYDYVLFIFMGLLPIAMLITAIILFALDPDKKKRININFRFSIIIRTVIMIQAAVVIYCLNIIWGMPVGFSVAYVPSLVIPMVYALFIPLSEVIFMNLLNSERYAAAD